VSDPAATNESASTEAAASLKPYGDELIALSRKLIELGGDPRLFTYHRLILFEIDEAATMLAGDGVLRFKPTQDYLETLAAMRRAAEELERPDV
jgi:hypothetical protein